VKGYRIWSPYENKVILSRNVVFDENSMLKPTVKFTISEDYGIEKQVEQRETEATCEEEEGSLVTFRGRSISCSISIRGTSQYCS
jgi:hypothetical protein